MRPSFPSPLGRFATRHWSTYSLTLFLDRLQNFQTTNEGDQITIRKLPAVEFQSRDRQIRPSLPIWVSLDSSAALARRTQPLFQTRSLSTASMSPAHHDRFALEGVSSAAGLLRSWNPLRLQRVRWPDQPRQASSAPPMRSLWT